MTLLTTFREPVRVMIADNDADINLVEDAQIDAAMRTVVDLARVTGTPAIAPDGYALDAGRLNIVPTLTPVSDPKAFAQLVYWTAKLFTGNLTPHIAWRTRAFSYSASTGANFDGIFHLLEAIYNLEQGDMGATTDYE